MEKEREYKNRRRTLTVTVAPETIKLLDQLLGAYNADGMYDISRGRVIDYLVLEAAKKKGIQIKRAEEK